MRTLLLAATVPVALAAAAPAALDPDLAKRLAGWVPGPPQQCLDATFVNGPATYRGALFYDDAGRRAYVNRLRGGCPFLRADDAVRIEVFGSKACSGDIVTPFEPTTHMIRPNCILGPFEPYERPDGQRRQ